MQFYYTKFSYFIHEKFIVRKVCQEDYLHHHHILQGMKGERGEFGHNGNPGMDGAKGEPGDKGPQGESAPNGLSSNHLFELHFGDDFIYECIFVCHTIVSDSCDLLDL